MTLDSIDISIIKMLQNDAMLREKRLEYAYLNRPQMLLEHARRRLAMDEVTPQQVRKLWVEE